MSGDKLSFIMGVHCHQPVGNFGWVMEEAFEKSYLPFLEFLSTYPKIKACTHISGPLLEWIEANRPDFLGMVRRLVSSGQLEVIGGGFYEPILMTIPMVDRLEQIEMLSTYAEKKMGMRPRGLWLTERIWEPTLPCTIKAAGIEYTVTDDTHFLQAGIPREKIRGYYLTEDEGSRCAVFPIDQNLRYAVPFKNPEETIEYLRKRYENGDRSCCTLIDDGEKFGLWPGTYKLLYSDEMWLQRFFDALLAESDWLEITTPSEYLDTHEPEGLVYLPTASYFEMGQWTLEPNSNRRLETLKSKLEEELKEQTEVFIKGGFFRNFFMRYPESNHMHKRMLEISRKLHLSNLIGQPRDEAKRELFQSQCNCAFWHGIFGGLYLPHLREAIYEHMIRAEQIAKPNSLSLEAYDLDLDGHEEITLRNEALTAIFSPFDGGTLIELDEVASCTNLLNTLARRFEAYHLPPENEHDLDGGSIHDLTKEMSEEERKLLVYDSGRRTCFRDSLLSPNQEFTPGMLRDLEYDRIAFLDNHRYSFSFEEGEREVSLEMRTNASYNEGSLEIVKSFFLSKQGNALGCRYSLCPDNKLEAEMAIQFNISTPAALGSESPFYLDGKCLENIPLLTPGASENAHSLTIRDPYRKLDVTIESEQACKILWHPLETVSQSESGFDRNYQASAIWILLPINIAANVEETFGLSLRVEPIE